MKIVSGILITFLFWGGVMPNNDFKELTKVPHLFEHFAELNNSVSTPLSFIDFLEMHYGAEKENHSDKHQGNGCLPLQHSSASSGVVFVFYDTTIALHTQLQPKANLVSYYLPFSSSSQLTPPWHPPKG